MRIALEDNIDNKILTFAEYFTLDNKPLKRHYFTRYIAEKTEMWFFCCGLGEQAMMHQMGDSFLKYIKTHGDPSLGKIMMALGNNEMTHAVWKGNFNCAWVWNFRNLEGWIPKYLKDTRVRPDLFLCPGLQLYNDAEEAGLACLKFNAGVNKEVFKPLNLQRRGLGYAGLDLNLRDEGLHIRRKKQYEAILQPVVHRKDFEWHGKTLKSKFLRSPDLNRWYNSKQILFGTHPPDARLIGCLSNRFYETVGSGTPFICFKSPIINDELGFQFSYQSDSAEKTLELVDSMLNHYEKTLQEFTNYSHLIHTNHSYEQRLETLFNYIMELKA